jgi:hypothetical protein
MSTDKIKTFLIEWLIRFGSDTLERPDDVDYNMLDVCVRFGYLDELRDPFTKLYNHKITNEGLDFIQRRKV